MVLQRESVDEDLEHFEDINEENEIQPVEASTSEQNEPSINGVEEADREEVADISAGSDDDDDDDFLLRNGTDDIPKPHAPSDTNVDKDQASSAITFLPGGYNPRHREPCFCNADCASWWELTVLASHVHPSVATMAGTILSGANIVYNGNPLVDLSLTAFLDKFMEKKPKQTTWHGSQIEPSQQLDMNHHLIGREILSLAETDVAPEDQVFHKFYMNKMSSSKKLKKKKRKTPEEEDTEDLYNVDGDVVEGGDESDNEEVEKLLDSADLETELNSDYDYDDLDKVAYEDDSDLVADDGSDAETDNDTAKGEDFGFDDEIDDQDGMADDGDEDDVDDDDDGSQKRKRKTKSRKKNSASPFASLEEYEHLLKDDLPQPKRRKDTNKTRKKLSS